MIILPDNDEVGRKHANQVANAIHGLANNVRIVELPMLEELAKNSNQKQTINFLRASINKCRALKRTLAKRLKYIVDGNLFYDLRPDLAEHARGGFLSQAISKGPDVVNKYIY